MPRFDTVLFDLDGTLINTIADLAWTSEQILTEWGRGNADGTPVHGYDAYHRFVGNGIRKLVERAFGGTLTESELDDAVQQFVALYNEHCAVKTAPYEGIIALLDELKARGLRMGVVTNKPEVQAKLLANKFFAAYNFCCVYGSVSDRPNKPDPHVVQLALDDCDATAERTLFVGDSDVDVETAHNAGLVCAGAVWGFRGEEELRRAGADILIAHPLELLASL